MITNVKSLEIFVEALNASKEPLFIVNSNNECTFANTAFFHLLGYPPSQEPLPISKFWPTVLSDIALSKMGSEEFFGFGGERFSVKLESHQLGEGNHLYRIVSSLSKSDPVNSFHAQRLETLGLLAGGVAHDFNNILMGILGHTTYLKTILPKQGPHIESLTAIEDGTRRGSAITQQILNFSKLDSQATAGPVDVGDLVIRTCTLIRRAVPAPHVFEYKEIEPNLKVLALEAQIAQILINLVVNARDALNSKGNVRVTVAVTKDDTELSKVFKKLERSAKSYARLTVTDTGHGIPEQLKDKIFQPYFSTKKEKGTGLGLATVDSIVRALGGAIDVASVVGEGSSLSVYLPIAEATSALNASVQSAVKVVGGTGRVLVVDDEYPVRNVLVISLQHLGYTVEAACSGKEALETFLGAERPFDLVITDMLMPQMSGDELFAELRKVSPDLKILIMSGFASQDAIQDLLNKGASGYLAKPFTIDELAKRVKQCIC